MNGPNCCGFPAHLNIISPRLQFYVCAECKNEVVQEGDPAFEDELPEGVRIYKGIELDEADDTYILLDPL